MKPCERCGSTDVHSHGTHLPDAATSPIATPQQVARELVKQQFPNDWKDQRNLTAAISTALDDERKRCAQIATRLAESLEQQGADCARTDAIVGGLGQTIFQGRARIARDIAAAIAAEPEQ